MAQVNPVGTFIVANDSRIFRANHQHCYGKKANISASFNLTNMTCNTCTFRGEHLVLHREVESADALNSNPVCFIRSDQCFPPIIPVEGDGECFKVFLIEDGTLSELVNAFLDFTSGFMVLAGSVVVLASASHLALVGTAAYAADFVNARNRLVNAMGGGVELVHGIPILLSGTEDSALIRSLADLEHWLGYVSTGRDIMAARRAFVTQTLGRYITANNARGTRARESTDRCSH
jgi:hypothetical protein